MESRGLDSAVLNAPYAFDNGVLCRPLTKAIEQVGKHWVSE
ncbi:MAG: hypothetical protein ACFCVD_24600 [Nodosilinea sp.]